MDTVPKALLGIDNRAVLSSSNSPTNPLKTCLDYRSSKSTYFIRYSVVYKL